MGNKSFGRSLFPSVCFHKTEGWPDVIASRDILEARGSLLPRGDLAVSVGIFGWHNRVDTTDI